MLFENELIKGKIVYRYKNLVADVELQSGEVVPVFCPEGDLSDELHEVGQVVYVSKAKDKRRKIAYDMEIASTGSGNVLINSGHNLEMFMEAFHKGELPDFNGYSRIRMIDLSEKINHIDFELSNKNGEKCYVFITNMYHKEGAAAVFPAQVSFFERQMFEEMHKLREKGHKTKVFMIAPRQDCLNVKFSWCIDPASAAKIFDEAKNGLEFVCYGCKISKDGVSIANKLEIKY